MKEADVWNSIPAPAEVYEQKLGTLRRACERTGRDYANIKKLWRHKSLISEDERRIDRLFERINSLKPVDTGSDDDFLRFLREGNPALETYKRKADFGREFMIGTPDEAEARLREYTHLGVTRFMLWFMDFPSLQGI